MSYLPSVIVSISLYIFPHWQVPWVANFQNLCICLAWFEASEVCLIYFIHWNASGCRDSRSRCWTEPRHSQDCEVLHMIFTTVCKIGMMSGHSLEGMNTKFLAMNPCMALPFSLLKKSAPLQQICSCTELSTWLPPAPQLLGKGGDFLESNLRAPFSWRRCQLFYVWWICWMNSTQPKGAGQWNCLKWLVMRLSNFCPPGVSEVSYVTSPSSSSSSATERGSLLVPLVFGLRTLWVLLPAARDALETVYLPRDGPGLGRLPAFLFDYFLKLHEEPDGWRQEPSALSRWSSKAVSD